MTPPSISSRAPLIALRRISKRFETEAGSVTALHGIDLSIYENDYIAITGPSGSGKSTLMNIIGCLDQPSMGSYKLQGREMRGLVESDLAKVRNRTFGFIFQAFNLLPRASVLQNVAQPLVYRGMPGPERARRAEQALRRVGLSRRATHLPNQLSGGEQQRVAIARALCAEPTILIADEPTGNLDSKTAEVILEILDGLHEAGQTILVVTHSSHVARRCKSQIAIIDGRIRRHAATLIGVA